MRTTCFWNNLQNRKIGKPNNLTVFASNKTKGPKQDSQNQLWLPRLIVKCLDLRNKLFNLYDIAIRIWIMLHNCKFNRKKDKNETYSLLLR